MPDETQSDSTSRTAKEGPEARDPHDTPTNDPTSTDIDGESSEATARDVEPLPDPIERLKRAASENL